MAEAEAVYYDRLQRVEDRVSKTEQEMASLQADHKGVMSDLYGNGRPGILDTLNSFVVDYNAREDERKKALNAQESAVKATLDRHNAKITWALTAIGLLMSAIFYMLSRGHLG
ncbi:MAG TPA: hypothetical protein VMQ76_03565 [Terracidiphilus sp.]|jgi:hypothetical protein|nr:hypothetical protein [Terracidiphilus sp.]